MQRSTMFPTGLCLFLKLWDKHLWFCHLCVSKPDVMIRRLWSHTLIGLQLVYHKSLSSDNILDNSPFWHLYCIINAAEKCLAPSRGLFFQQTSIEIRTLFATTGIALWCPLKRMHKFEAISCGNICKISFGAWFQLFWYVYNHHLAWLSV